MRRSLPLRQKLLAGLSALSVTLLAACGAAQATETGQSSESTTGQTSTSETTSVEATDATTVDDAMSGNVEYVAAATDVDTSTAVAITLSGSTATSDSDAVELADDGTVTVTSAGTYVLSGDLAGQIVVDTDDDGAVTLVLDGADITSSTTAAIAFMSADVAVVVLADGTTNSLTDAVSYVYPDSETDEPNAALFSTADLTIGGSGALTVTGNSNDAIGSKDGLVVTGGTISLMSVDDGIRGKDYLVVTGGDITVDTEGDGLKSDNDSDAGTGYVLLTGGDVVVSSGDDAVKGEQQVLIAGGALDITASYEGVESMVIIMDDGEVWVVSSDDGLNASAGSTDEAADDAEGGPGGGGMQADDSLQIHINGGTLQVDADGDGLDSNGGMSITGGTITVNGPTDDGNGALDTNGSFTVSGGSLVAVGSAGMAESPDDSSGQAWIATSFDAQDAGSTVVVTDANGDVVLEYTADKAFASLVWSDAVITAGDQYTVTVDGSELATVTAGEATSGGMGGGPGGGGGRPGDEG